mmetsp:Transcript_59020/g.97597  ORF Transcript_59020/g.97597 Transcript_59020/m.97597 type:complete len:352 (-) Transcript_59020:471-1526(-)
MSSYLPEMPRAWLAAIDSRVNLKHVYRKMQFTARFLIVSTFMDDALRVACDYRGQVQTMRGVQWGTSFGAMKTVSRILPTMFILVQAVGVFLILSEKRPQAGCVTLLVWAGVHPFMYAQQRNLEFLLESLTIIGGLLILLSSERTISRARARLQAVDLSSLPLLAETQHGSASATSPEVSSAKQAAEETGRLLFAGRIALSAVFVFYVVKMMNERLAHITGHYNEDPLVAMMYGVLLVLLMIVTGLLVMGMKSRWCAMVLAAIMGCSALYKHPWYITMWSNRSFRLDFVVGYEDVQVDAWLYSDHQRYFFFQQLSTVGALLQLVVHGPGKYSIDESEGPEQVVSLTIKGVD